MYIVEVKTEGEWAPVSNCSLYKYQAEELARTITFFCHKETRVTTVEGEVLAFGPTSLKTKEMAWIREGF